MCRHHVAGWARASLRRLAASLFVCFVAVAVAVAGAGELCAQAEAKATQQRDCLVAFSPGKISIDGEGNEAAWRVATPLYLRERAQLISTGQEAWSGPLDASAELRLLYDKTHLYLLAHITDQEALAPTSPAIWSSGDVLELFFNLDPSDDHADETQFNDDDLQLVFPLYDPHRPWVAIDPHSLGNQGNYVPKAIELGLTGILVARRKIKGGLVLEASLPLHIFTALEPGQKEIGFNVALGDRDDGGRIYNYLVWSGGKAPYNNTERLGLLRFAGAAVLVPGAERSSPAWQGVLPFAMDLLPCLLAFCLLFLAWRINRARPKLGRVLGLACGALLLLALLGPDLGLYLRTRSSRAQLYSLSQKINEVLPTIDRVALAGFRGPSRDEPLLSLLSGAQIRQKRAQDFRLLSELPGTALSLPLMSFPNEGFSIYSYGLALDEKGLELPIEAQGARDRLCLVLSRPLTRETNRAHAKLKLEFETGAGLLRHELSFDQALASFKGSADRQVSWTSIEIPDDTKSMRLFTARADLGYRLEGLSRLPVAHGSVGRPLLMGDISRLGIPTALRGAYPKDAGFILPGGKSVALDLAAVERDVEQVWLFMEAVEGPSFSQTQDGSEVLSVELVSPERGAQVVRHSLRHLEDVFAGRKAANSEAQRLGQPGHAAVAYEWEERQGDVRITTAVALDHGKAKKLSTIRVKNIGKYVIKLRAIVLARATAVALPQAEGDQVLQASGSGHLRLAPAILDQSRLAEYRIFRQEKLSASSHSPDGEVHGSKLPSGLAQRLSTEGFVFAKQSGEDDNGTTVAFMPVRSEGFEDAVLAITLRDPGYKEFKSLSWLTSLLLGGMSLPFFLVFLFQSLAPARSLRWQLTGTVLFGTVVPLLLLSIFLVRLMEKDQEHENQRQVQEDLALLEERIELAGLALERDASLLLQKIAKEIQSRPVHDKSAATSGDLIGKLREILALARPADWPAGSFMTLDLADPAVRERDLRISDPEDSQWLTEIALLPGFGLYSEWGRIFIGARADLELPGQMRGKVFGETELLHFSWGRVLDARWFEQQISRGFAGLYSLQGYPLVLARSTQTAAGEAQLFDLEREVEALHEKQELLERAKGAKGIDTQMLSSGGEERLFASTFLRDRSGKDLALLACFDRPALASLPFLFGKLSVRRFFVSVVGLLLILAVFLAWLVTDRIALPVEKLESLALRLSMGDLDVKVEPVSGTDEVANLNRAFGKMATQLKERITQQDAMNQAIMRLNHVLEFDALALEAIAIFKENSAADGVLFLSRNREEGGIVVLGQTQESSWNSQGSRDGLEHAHESPDKNPLLVLLFQAAGAFSCRLDPSESHAFFPELSGSSTCLGMPLFFQGRRWGGLLLAFERTPSALDLEHLAALSRQVLSALESARLYSLGIEDAPSGLYVARYFRRRFTQALDGAERNGGRVSLLRLHVRQADRHRKALGDTAFDHLLSRAGELILHEIPHAAIAGRMGLASFEILLSQVERKEAVQLLLRLQHKLSNILQELGVKLREPVEAGLATFPEEGRSASFLRDTLQRSMGRVGSDPDTVAAPAKDGSGVRRGDAVFASKAMCELLDTLKRVAPTDLPLLILGETGVGKEVLVDLCHSESGRPDAPLIKVNCAAIPETLLEAALFGHERGAFTGALERKKGFFEEADKGSLFLDEIGDLPLALQAKLLRVLQSKEVLRLGATKPRLVDVRIIAATHQDLVSKVQEGTFREDLYYRLQGVQLLLPPLRERKEEIPLLVEKFRRDFGSGARECSAAALDLLHRHSWPGNIRELQNVLRRAFVLARGEFIEPEDLDIHVLTPVVVANGARPDGNTVGKHENERVGSLPLEASNGDTEYLIPRRGQQTRSADVEERWQQLRSHLERCMDAGEKPATGITPRAYCDLLQVSRRTASRDLSAWTEQGRLQALGLRRSLRYFLVETAQKPS